MTMSRRFRVIPPNGPYITGFRHEHDVTDFDVTVEAVREA